jgi:hypothetical protein
LSEALRPDQTIQTLQILVDVAVMTGNVPLGERYGPLLREHAGRCAGPFEDARALLSLAGLEYAFGTRAAAEQHLAQARAIVRKHRYYELQFEAERLTTRFASDLVASMSDAAPHAELAGVQLNGRCQYIADQLDRESDIDSVEDSVLQV